MIYKLQHTICGELYETTVDAQGHWAICEEGAGDVIADLMTQEIAEKICVLLNNEKETA